MKICIGGELNGQVLEKTPDDYFQQSIVIGENTYKFWFSDNMSFFEASKEAEKLARQK